MGRSRREDHRPGRIGATPYAVRREARAITSRAVREGRVRPGRAWSRQSGINGRSWSRWSRSRSWSPGSCEPETLKPFRPIDHRQLRGRSRARFSRLRPRPQVDEPVDAAHQHRAADHVAERDRQEIAREKPPQVSTWASRPRAATKPGSSAGQEQRERHEIHVGDGVLEAGGHERGDRRHDRQHPVGGAAGAVGEPDGQAYEHVAQDAEQHRLDEPQLQLRRSRSRARWRRRRRRPPRAVARPTPGARCRRRRRSCPRRRGSSYGAAPTC